MKRIYLASVAVAAFLTGCAANGELVKKGTVSSRNDIFVAVADGGPVPPGSADLQVGFSVKTHSSGSFLVKDAHGTPDYKLLLNLDGQVVQVQANLRRENSEPRGLRDPEAGEGIRYQFRKTIRLPPGSHKIVVGLPADEIAVEREIILSAGKVNKLVLEPVYSVSSGATRPHTFTTSFKQGLRTIRLTLNDAEL